MTPLQYRLDLGAFGCEAVSSGAARLPEFLGIFSGLRGDQAGFAARKILVCAKRSLEYLA
jgi:hypothetical protein